MLFKRIGFFFLYFLFFLNTFAVENKSVWLNTISKPGVSTQLKMQYSDSLLSYFRKSNPDSAIYAAHCLLRFSTLLKDTGLIDYAYSNLGSQHRRKGNFDSSLFYYRKALDSYKARSFEEGVAAIYNNLATVYKTQGRFDLAIKNYHEALQIFKNSKRYFARANLYSNFAGLYFKLENYQKALEYWNLAKVDYAKDGGSVDITYSMRGIGGVYLKQGKTLLAEKQLLEALQLDRKNKINVLILEDLITLMELYLKTGMTRKFVEAMASAKLLLKDIDFPLSRASFYQHYGDFLILDNKPAMAVIQFDSSLLNIKGEDVPEMKLTILKKRLTAKILAKQFDNTYAQILEIEELEKKVLRIRQDRVVQESEARYNLKDKQDLIVALNEKNKSAQKLIVKERELKAQKQWQITILLIGIALVCLFFVYVLFLNKRLNKTKKELEMNIEQRDFLFKELNHRVKNNLHIVNSFLGIEMHGRSNEVKDILQACENRIHSLGLVHEMLYQSDVIEKVELKPYFEKLSSFIDKTLTNSDVKIEVEVLPNHWVNSNKAVLIGLIVNELLTNAIKYAKDPKRQLIIKVEARYIEKSKIQIEINDNGVGLPPDFNPNKSGSLGMRLAFGLSKQLNGSFSFSNLEPGTSFKIVFQN